MVVHGKIDAIKKVREVGYAVQIIKNDVSGFHELHPGIGLKEAKDLVEAICDMAVRDFIGTRAPRVAELRRIIEELVTFEPMQRS